ncbi:hypothetical protein Afil01_01700 [Actinorhabdospora filicis]|uniref:Uncharacterized protein n=1 Tax=Actinorhabdospora filicis TaxID=1785913 RepID=A0A9W6SFH9_9ACTN|nr:hypothetical protein [Actinorhabdospora filicis]GLZ75363.1 hypothetical protein Afil01_01700 [Actinorhabdospora filicis]
MIVGSLLILVAAAGLLVAGLMNANDTFLILSIVASVVAGAGLFFGARAAARYGDEDDVAEAERAPRVREPAFPPRRRLEARTPAKDDFDGDEAEPVAPVQPSAAEREVLPPEIRPEPELEPEDEPVEIDLSDEPAELPVSRIDATRLAGLTVPVQVVDGRPRFHLAGCVHLLGKEDEALPVNEAVELGFTPCALCEPTAEVLADLAVRSGH